MNSAVSCLGHFPLELYCAIPMAVKSELNYLRLEWGADFQQHEAGLIAGDDIPLLTTSSASLARRQLMPLKGCTWLPTAWAREQSELYPVSDSTPISRPLYAIWLQNSDKQPQIRDILKNNVF
ncbi:transcriptional regulator HdfR [Kluyvera cryocrescens]|uniref:Transcriptional regulator HdfR n=1 Tax=Kluyvera cryocrescens TaxID=580 RepID=A0A485BHN2_KLUCR|nr:transcriptional regulator HdfR [Kluyvera cryocrescens]